MKCLGDKYPHYYLFQGYMAKKMTYIFLIDKIVISQDK